MSDHSGREPLNSPESPEGLSKALEAHIRAAVDSGNVYRALDGLLREALVRMLEELDALRGLVDEIQSITVNKAEIRLKISHLIAEYYESKKGL